MRLSDLEKFSIPRRIVNLWGSRYGEQLLPVQKRAIRKGLLGLNGTRPVNMVISAPTSSGKSFCAEMAALQALAARRKAVMLFPLKSLAEEKFRQLEQTYRPLGIKCLIATGDHSENDHRFVAGDFHLAVAIYEKFDLLLTSQLDVLKNIGCLVIDELQMIAEKGRGAHLERLLTRVVASEYTPHLIGLSAVVGDEAAEKLSRWLKGEVVEETTRPVDLVRGVAATGSFQYRSYNSGEDGSEPFDTPEPGCDAFDSFLGQLKTGSGPTLVFVKSRADTVNLAFRLASVADWPSASKALEQLKEDEVTYLTRSLLQILTRGVAFHNSDLAPAQRHIIEQAFVNKEVKVIISTTTLAMGVNLPAETVYLETVKYDSGAYDNRPALVPVSRAEFDNMTGRAGRLGLNGGRPGRAIVLAESEFDRDILWEQYIAPARPQVIDSVFESLPAEDWLLHMIVCGLIRRREDITGVFACSYKAALEPTGLPDFGPPLEHLVSHNFVHRDLADRLTPTPAGKAVASSGLKVAEAVSLRKRLDQQYPETRFGWIALALSSPDWTLPPGILSRAEQADNRPVKLLYQRFDHASSEVGCLIGSDHHQRPLTYRQAAALKALLLLDDWCRLVPVRQLEECYQMHLGQIMNLGEAAAHLLTALRKLIEASDRENPMLDNLTQYAFSMRHGLPADFRDLHQALGGTLNRSDFIALKQGGITSLRELADQPDEELQRLLIGDAKRMSIKEQLQILKEEVAMSATQLSSCVMISSEPDSVEIDGTYERERYLIRINGFPVRLTGKSFKYLLKLAWSRLNSDSGWVYKEDIEVGFNQARYLYRMKNEIKAGLNSGWTVVENNRLGYYRLSINPEKIAISIANLKDFPDHEVQDLLKSEVSDQQQGLCRPSAGRSEISPEAGGDCFSSIGA